jgi:class 3 adenylate cyclase
MDVGTWLSGLGLGQYEAVFRENEIEADVLTELTDQHLKDLGVSLGHRLKILRAIREIAAVEAKPQDAAERRHMTVMFCDLVDSTALTAQFDPEDMGDLLRAFQGVVAEAVARFDGHVARWLGDGASVYFG